MEYHLRTGIGENEYEPGASQGYSWDVQHQRSVSIFHWEYHLRTGMGENEIAFSGIRLSGRREPVEGDIGQLPRVASSEPEEM